LVWCFAVDRKAFVGLWDVTAMRFVCTSQNRASGQMIFASVRRSRRHKPKAQVAPAQAREHAAFTMS